MSAATRDNAPLAENTDTSFTDELLRMRQHIAGTTVSLSRCKKKSSKIRKKEEVFFALLKLTSLSVPYPTSFNCNSGRVKGRSAGVEDARRVSHSSMAESTWVTSRR